MSECWEWLGRRSKEGYGRFWRNGKEETAHREAYRRFVGPIPEGLCVLLTCDNPPCVRPEHLWVGTRTDNNKDRVTKARNGESYRAQATHCLHGHLYDEATLRYGRNLRPGAPYNLPD